MKYFYTIWLEFLKTWQVATSVTEVFPKDAGDRYLNVPEGGVGARRHTHTGGHSTPLPPPGTTSNPTPSIITTRVSNTTPKYLTHHHAFTHLPSVSVQHSATAQCIQVIIQGGKWGQWRGERELPGLIHTPATTNPTPSQTRQRCIRLRYWCFTLTPHTQICNQLPFI